MLVRKPSGITLKGLNISKGAGKLVRRKVDVRTVCIALEVDADASEKCTRPVASTGRPAICSSQSSCPIQIGKNGSGNGTTCTRLLIRWFEPKMSVLGAQLACNVMRSVSSMYQSWISNHRTSRRIRRWCSRASASGILFVHLDKNTIRFFNNYTEASVYTVNGRVGVRLRPGKFQLSQLAGFLAEELAGTSKENRIYKARRMQPRLEVRHQRHVFQMGVCTLP